MFLSARSGLEQLLLPGNYGIHTNKPGVVIALRTDLALASVMVRKGKIKDLRLRVHDGFGLMLPLTAQRADSGILSFTWAGPGQWLAATSGKTPVSFEAELRDLLSGLASVMNQSDGRCIIRVSGPKARDVMAKGIPIDLDPRVFGPGDTALTLAGHINVHLWQVDAAPTYEFAVFRSFAASFSEWFLAASAAFGLSVVVADNAPRPSAPAPRPNGASGR
jgi:sarcosine oxidase subunit gamma